MKRKQYKSINTKVMNIFFTLLLIITMVSVGEIHSRAANTMDTEWSFNISTSNNTYQKSDIRPKYDSSSFYVFWSTAAGPTSFYLQTYGGLTSFESSMVPYNYNGAVYVQKTGRYSVRSLVYENLGGSGKTVHACFGVKAVTTSGYIGGVWSPDSAGSYNVLSMP